MTYMKVVQYSGSSVLTDVEVQVLSRAFVKCYSEKDYGLPRIEEGFFFVFLVDGSQQKYNTFLRDGGPAAPVWSQQRTSSRTVVPVGKPSNLPR
jgi:hypothetical protein